MTRLAAPPPDDGTCDCCGCAPDAHGASLLGLALCVAALRRENRPEAGKGGA